MTTMKKISILVITAGVLLPVASLGFVDHYNPALGFVWNVSHMRIFHFNPLTLYYTYTQYSSVIALGCALIFLGVVGFLFDRQLTRPISELGSPSETPAENETRPDGSPGRDLES